MPLSKRLIGYSKKSVQAATSLSNLNDVSFTSLADDEVLTYDNDISKWVNGPAGGASNIQGSVSTGYVPYATTTNTLGDGGLQWNTGDYEYLTITASNSGVNQLQLKNLDAASSANGLLVRDEANASRFEFGFNNSADENYIWAWGDYPLKIATSGTERMRILADGKVGIGTDSPTTKLDVRGTTLLSGNTAITGTLDISSTIDSGEWNGTAIANDYLASSSVSYGGVSVDLGASDPTPAFDLADATNYEGTAVKSTGEGGGTKFLREDGDGTCSWQATAGSTSPGGSDTYVQFNDGGSFGGSANFVWDGTNVGIGTDSPTEKLDVRGTTLLSGTTTVNGTFTVSPGNASYIVTQAIKNDIVSDTALSSSYNRYFAQSIAGDSPGANITRLTAPASPSVGDEYFIVASTYHNGNPQTGSAQVVITADSGDTINKTAGAIEIALTVSSDIATTANYRTAHLICVEADTWAMTISDYGPTS